MVVLLVRCRGSPSKEAQPDLKRLRSLHVSVVRNQGFYPLLLELNLCANWPHFLLFGLSSLWGLQGHQIMQVVRMGLRRMRSLLGRAVGVVRLASDPYLRLLVLRGAL